MRCKERGADGVSPIRTAIPPLVAAMTARRPHPTDAVLERLSALHPKLIDLGLGRTERLLAALEPGNPYRLSSTLPAPMGRVPPSPSCRRSRRPPDCGCMSIPQDCAVQRTDRARRRPVGEEALLAILENVVANDGAPITFFEITTAAALLLGRQPIWYCWKPSSEGVSNPPKTSTPRARP